MQLFKTKRGYLYKRAVVSKGKVWYIEFKAYHPQKGKLDRVRKTYGINRIKDLKARHKKANHICKKINFLLPKDFPFTNPNLELHIDEDNQDYNVELIKLLTNNNVKDGQLLESLASLLLSKIGLSTNNLNVLSQEKKKDKGDINLMEGIDIGYKFKFNTKSELSEASNSSRKNLFVQWLEKNKLTHLNLNEFLEEHAREYMDYWEFEKKVSNNTYNNKRTFVKSLFEELKERKYLKENPFDCIKRKKKLKKIHDIFEPEEMALVSKYYKEHRPWMYKAMLLQFFCWIRPVELRRLKFGMFDLKRGQIKFKGKDTKNDNDDNITIPKAIIKDFCNPEFAKYPAHHYVFGYKLKPAKGKCGAGSMNGLHNSILNELKINRPGVYWYTWKHLGVTILPELEDLNPMEIKNHGRWGDFEVINHYLHRSGKVMPSIQKIEKRYI